MGRGGLREQRLGRAGTVPCRTPAEIAAQEGIKACVARKEKLGSIRTGGHGVKSDGERRIKPQNLWLRALGGIPKDRMEETQQAPARIGSKQGAREGIKKHQAP